MKKSNVFIKRTYHIFSLTFLLPQKTGVQRKPIQSNSTTYNKYHLNTLPTWLGGPPIFKRTISFLIEGRAFATRQNARINFLGLWSNNRNCSKKIRNK